MTKLPQARKLWDLLGQSPRPAAPPFFAGKVLHQIKSPATAPWMSLVLRWLAPATVAALVVLAVLPHAEPAASGSAELTILDLVELVSPEDHAILLEAGWPYSNGSLTAGL